MLPSSSRSSFPVVSPIRHAAERVHAENGKECEPSRRDIRAREQACRPGSESRAARRGRGSSGPLRRRRPTRWRRRRSPWPPAEDWPGCGAEAPAAVRAQRTRRRREIPDPERKSLAADARQYEIHRGTTGTTVGMPGPWPKKAIASSGGGKARMISAAVRITNSIREPKRPEIASKPTAIAPEIGTTVAATTGEFRAPKTMRFRMSRPTWSVPKRIFPRSSQAATAPRADPVGWGRRGSREDAGGDQRHAPWFLPDCTTTMRRPASGTRFPGQDKQSPPVPRNPAAPPSRFPGQNVDGPCSPSSYAGTNSREHPPFISADA